MKRSEFGRGLIVNLVKFAEHFENPFADKICFINQFMEKDEKSQKLMLSDNPPSSLNYGRPYMEDIKFWVEKIVPIHKTIEKAFSSEITAWANGSSDHLYDIELPKKLENTELGRKIILLRKLGLDMGHGRGLMGQKLFTFKDFARLYRLTEEIALMIDKNVFKLKADLGKF